MHVISEKKLREFWEKWPAAEEPLRAWHRVAKHAAWESFADIRQVYVAADQPPRVVSDVLDGGDVLPGFVMSLPELFAELDD